MCASVSDGREYESGCRSAQQDSGPSPMAQHFAKLGYYNHAGIDVCQTLNDPQQGPSFAANAFQMRQDHVVWSASIVELGNT